MEDERINMVSGLVYHNTIKRVATTPPTAHAYLTANRTALTCSRLYTSTGHSTSQSVGLVT